MRSSSQGALLSLKGKALQLLAQREHSEIELRRKLLSYAHRLYSITESSHLEKNSNSTQLENGAFEAEINALLHLLQESGYFSPQRFVESRIHARESRFGNTRILYELSQHGVHPDSHQLQQLKNTELERATTVWKKKFGMLPDDEQNSSAAKAKQIRFLTQRGFSPATAQRVLRQRTENKNSDDNEIT
jgi:regulatory protein